MRIGWMPYFEIAYPLRGPKTLEVGKARFVPDSDDVWANEIKRSRPEYLDMFRNFPPVTGDEPGAPIRGTVVLCEDHEWLETFLDEAVAVVYFLGDKPRPSQPAERFTYYELHLKSDAHKPAELVSFITKHGEIREHETSIVIYPPLVLRGSLGQYRVNLDRPEHKKLLELMKNDPRDRLIVAVRRYFRTQFSDVFASPFQSDYSTHCSAIEAALNLETRHKAGDKFVRALADIYADAPYTGPAIDEKVDHTKNVVGRIWAWLESLTKGNTKKGVGEVADASNHDSPVEQFFRGLYVARSLYVHGGTTQAVESGQSMDDRAYRYFRSRRGKLSVLRILSRDTILLALGRSDGSFGFEHPDSARPLLRKMLHSDNLADRIVKLLNRGGSADTITKMTDDAFKEVERVAIAMSADLEWDFVTKVVNPKHMHKALVTCALMITRLVASGDPVYEAGVTLGKSAHANDAEAIRKWSIDHHEWGQLTIEQGNRLGTIQLIAASLAMYFARNAR